MLGSVEILIDGVLLSKPTELAELIVDLGHVLAHDHLKLRSRDLGAQHAVDFLYLLDIGCIDILEIEAQTRHTMRHKRNVFLASDGFEHIGCNLLVVSHS